MRRKSRWSKIIRKTVFCAAIIFAVIAEDNVLAAETESTSKTEVFYTAEGDFQCRRLENRSIEIIESGLPEVTERTCNTNLIFELDDSVTLVNDEQVFRNTDTMNKGIGNELKQKNTEVTLYVLPEDYQQYLSIPKECQQSYNLAGHTYGKIQGSSIKISNGFIVPKVELWYYHQEPDFGFWISQSTPSGVEGEIVKKKHIYGDSKIVIDGKTVIFHVCDYAEAYSRQIMDQYLAANITSDMTDCEKAEVCCKFVAGYEYGTEHTNYTGMIVTGSGDCWASTRMLLYMLDQLGIQAKARSASQDPGAGSGHENVLAVLDGFYYVLDAGYNEEAPRNYSIWQYSSSDEPYVYSVISKEEKTIRIEDYYDFGKKEIVIPSEIDGYTVVEIGRKAFFEAGSLEKHH